ncbi:MAG: hypothetical protein GQ547_05735 [Methylophaga sp.]|nr:hypothetical protein [Methylophaga sp.]
MTIKWSNEDNLIVIHVSGILTKPDLDNCQSEIEPIVQKGQAKLLVLVTDFEGWDDNSGDWTDLSFGERNDQYMDKMAIVGEEKWQLLTEMFTLKVLREFPIEYFKSGQEEFAREWLG